MKKKKALQALAALAQESRLDIFHLLLGYGETGLPAGEISEMLAIPATTASFHLSQLKAAGLIDFRKEGRSVIYSANFKRAKKLSRFITGRDKGEEDEASAAPLL